jgi:uncharacterized protein
MGQGEMKRVVLDTNVLVSALLFGGVPGKLVPVWRNGRIEPLCSDEIIREYLRVLAYPKFHLSESEIDYLFKYEILPFFSVVNFPPGKSFIPEDPADDKFMDKTVTTTIDEGLCTGGQPPAPLRRWLAGLHVWGV